MITNTARKDKSRPVILCVEDEIALRRDMVEELDEAGYTAIEAANGTEALARMEAVRPDLILCDINMPDTNGYQVLDAVRKRYPEYADIPFVFLTALADPREVVAGKRAGADDYLVKPVDFDLMLATIEARLGQIDRIRRQGAIDLEGLRKALSGDTGAVQPGWVKGIEQALDLVAIGIVLIDQAGKVALANQAALQISADSLAILPGESLKARSGLDRKRLKEAMDQIMADAATGQASVLPCPLQRAPGQRDLMLVACAIPAGQAAQASGLAAALFITDPDNRPRTSASILASLFSLTPTEAQVALELAEGCKPADIAVALGIAQTTLAFHMRNLFQKTGTNRQAELVALVLAGPAAVGSLPQPQTE